MGVHKDVLHKEVGVAAVVEEPADAAAGGGVNHVGLLGAAEQLPGAHVPLVVGDARRPPPIALRFRRRAGAGAAADGDAIAVADGDVIAVADGDVITVADGDVIIVANGDVITVADGDVIAVGDGDVIAVADGDVIAVGNGDVITVGDGDVIAVAEGDVIAVTDGDVIAVVNGDVIAVGDGDVITVTDGDVIAVVNGDVITVGDRDVIAVHDGNVITVANGDVIAVGDRDMIAVVNVDVITVADGDAIAAPAFATVRQGGVSFQIVVLLAVCQREIDNVVLEFYFLDGPSVHRRPHLAGFPSPWPNSVPVEILLVLNFQTTHRRFAPTCFRLTVGPFFQLATAVPPHTLDAADFDRWLVAAIPRVRRRLCRARVLPRKLAAGGKGSSVAGAALAAAPSRLAAAVGLAKRHGCSSRLRARFIPTVAVPAGRLALVPVGGGGGGVLVGLDQVQLGKVRVPQLSPDPVCLPRGHEPSEQVSDVLALANDAN